MFTCAMTCDICGGVFLIKTDSDCNFCPCCGEAYLTDDIKFITNKRAKELCENYGVNKNNDRIFKCVAYNCENCLFERKNVFPK